MLKEFKSSVWSVVWSNTVTESVMTEWYSVYDLAASSGDGRDDKCGFWSEKMIIIDVGSNNIMRMLCLNVIVLLSASLMALWPPFLQVSVYAHVTLPCQRLTRLMLIVTFKLLWSRSSLSWRATATRFLLCSIIADIHIYNVELWGPAGLAASQSNFVTTVIHLIWII